METSREVRNLQALAVELPEDIIRLKEHGDLELALKVMYSFVRSYFTIPQQVTYIASGMKGDCGLQALLFITMCRIAGIPAGWQSGLYANPRTIGCHDWAEFYIEPYGWLFADCSFGGAAYRAGHPERWEFYFGNLGTVSSAGGAWVSERLLLPKEISSHGSV